MNYFILSFFLVTSLFSSSLNMVDLYRTEGITAVEKEIRSQLKTKNYWNLTLKNKEVNNGYYESIKYILMCQKDFKNIKIYDTNENKQLFHSDVFIGKAKGDKKIEGDLKTPIGAYELKRRITKIDSFYGPLAITTNYPNMYDKSRGKTGHGIWIHGLPLDQERDDFTQGCIALDNKKIMTLDKKINLKESILVVSEKKLKPVSKDDLSTILSNIFQWRDAWKYSDLDEYLSFYSSEFKKSNGQNLKQFSLYKKRIFSRNQKKTIKLYNINIIPYPNDLSKKMYKIVMSESYKTRTYKFNGKKELYVEIVNDRISILAES